MAAPRKYPDELRERATRMAVDARRDPATRSGALKRIGEQLGINPETLRKEAYTIKAFIEAVNKIDGLKEPFHINPQRILKQPSAK